MILFTPVPLRFDWNQCRVALLAGAHDMAGFSFCHIKGRRGCRDLRPAAHLLFFASPKKSKQKKGDPAVCVPALRCGQPAVRVAGGFRLELGYRLKQSPALIHLQLCSSAHTEGAKRIPLMALCATLPSCQNNSGSSRSNALQSRASSAAPHAVMRRRVAQGAAGKEAQMFEPAGRVSAPSAGPEQRSVPAAQRRVDESGSPSLCLLSIGEARESESPAGARPGLHLQPKHSKKSIRSTSLVSAQTGHRTKGSV
jgi:hypothetical protein